MPATTTLPARPQLRHALPLLLMLLWLPASVASSPGPTQATVPDHSSKATETAADRPVPPDSSAASGADAAIDDGREDLTVFFTIGVIVDVLLVAAFLIWAAGQWRKPRK